MPPENRAVIHSTQTKKSPPQSIEVSFFPSCDPDRIRTCDRLLSLPPTAFTAPAPIQIGANLWSGLSLRHLRRAAYSLYGTLPLLPSRKTGYSEDHRFPRDCPTHLPTGLGFPDTAASTRRVLFPAARLLLLKGRCSIQLSYGTIFPKKALSPLSSRKYKPFHIRGKGERVKR